jgi:hypothetical protein
MTISPTRRPSGLHPIIVAALAAAGLAAATAHAAEQQFPDVVAAGVQSRDSGTFDFEVTVSSPYDTPQRYADAFRVTGPDGTMYGERRLLHDHAGEQPFTRELHDVAVPAGVKKVTVQARDKKYGYGGKTAEVELPGR